VSRSRGRGRELKELEDRRKTVHLKTIGSWIALAVCVVSVVIAWDATTRLVWLAVTPFAGLAVWISLRTERQIDSRMRELVPDALVDGRRAGQGSSR
jgi:Flp pilus assembly protein TadB